MNHIIGKLSEIEGASVSIIKQAEEKKRQMEQENQKAMDLFDEQTKAETEKKLAEIRKDLERKMSAELSGRQKIVDEAILSLKNDFEANHTAYAKQILKQITEV